MATQRLNGNSVRAVLVKEGFRANRRHGDADWGGFSVPAGERTAPVIEVSWQPPATMDEDRARAARPRILRRYTEALRSAGYECRTSNGRLVLVSVPVRTEASA